MLCLLRICNPLYLTQHPEVSSTLSSPGPRSTSTGAGHSLTHSETQKLFEMKVKKENLSKVYVKVEESVKIYFFFKIRIMNQNIQSTEYVEMFFFYSFHKYFSWRNCVNRSIWNFYINFNFIFWCTIFRLVSLLTTNKDRAVVWFDDPLEGLVHGAVRLHQGTAGGLHRPNNSHFFKRKGLF